MSAPVTSTSTSTSTSSAEPTADDLDDLADFLAELNRDLRAATPPKKSGPRKVTFADVVVPQQWFPAGVTLIVNTQRCRCGCEAQSVEGLFLTDQHRNGALRETRHSPREPIPDEYLSKARTIKEVTQAIDMCPACFHAAAILTSPAAEPNIPEL